MFGTIVKSKNDNEYKRLCPTLMLFDAVFPGCVHLSCLSKLVLALSGNRNSYWLAVTFFEISCFIQPSLDSYRLVPILYFFSSTETSQISGSKKNHLKPSPTEKSPVFCHFYSFLWPNHLSSVVFMATAQSPPTASALVASAPPTPSRRCCAAQHRWLPASTAAAPADAGQGTRGSRGSSRQSSAGAKNVHFLKFGFVGITEFLRLFFNKWDFVGLFFVETNPSDNADDDVLVRGLVRFPFWKNQGKHGFYTIKCVGVPCNLFLQPILRLVNWHFVFDKLMASHSISGYSPARGHWF